MELNSLALAFLLYAVSRPPAAVHLAPADTARLVDGHVLVEPLGASVAVPPLWLGGPVPAYYPQYWCARTPRGSVADRVIVEHDRLPTLRDAKGEFAREFSAAADSALSLTGLVAQFGGDPWSAPCSAPQVRLYIADLTPAALDSAAARGAAAAAHFFAPVRREAADTAGWHVARLTWHAWYHDYGSIPSLEFWARPVGGRTLVLVFMLIGLRPTGELGDRDAILSSLRTQQSTAPATSGSTTSPP
ncbi:MAG TPA: hypothetical protein VGD56_21485 [Gemmatirosa sp.]